jgi:hypothetical protein
MGQAGKYLISFSPVTLKEAGIEFEVMKLPQ